MRYHPRSTRGSDVLLEVRLPSFHTSRRDKRLVVQNVGLGGPPLDVLYVCLDFWVERRGWSDCERHSVFTAYCPKILENAYQDTGE